MSIMEQLNFKALFMVVRVLQFSFHCLQRLPKIFFSLHWFPLKSFNVLLISLSYRDGTSIPR